MFHPLQLASAVLVLAFATGLLMATQLLRQQQLSNQHPSNQHPRPAIQLAAMPL